MEDQPGVSLPRIGTLFVATGLITQAELEACLRLKDEVHPDLPLGQILLRYGYVSAEDLARVLVLQRASCPHCGYHSHMPTARFCGGCGIALGLTCASCGLIQTMDRQRCAQCDQPLPRGCADCGSLNLPEARFCANCSALLSEGQAPLVALRGQRRRVSVLFADIRGFTTFAHALDSEQVYLMVDGLLRLLAEEVQRFGGAIDKFTGDGLMATFGAVRALEHHAAQALHAGLAMQEVARHYGDTMEAGFGSRLELRIGINSGTVVAGELGSSRTRDYTVLGDTVNLAARLESAARPGSVLVSEMVREQATGGFLFEAREPLSLKGYAEPIKSYEVTGQRGVLEQSQDEGLAELPFQGRQQELNQLVEQAEALEQGRGVAALIVGEAGYGKTRLVRELHRRVVERGVLLIATRGQPHSQMIPYRIIQELVWQILGLSEQSGGPVAADMVAEALERLALPNLEDITAAIQHLLGLGPYKPELKQRIEHLEPAQRKLQISLSVTALIEHVLILPTLLIIEDLQWSDRLSRELIGALGAMAGRRPLMLVATSRPTNMEAIDDFSRGVLQAGTTLCECTLGPLAPEEMGALLSELTSQAPLPEAMAQRLIERAEGNPLFIEELVRTLLDPALQEGAAGQAGAAQLDDVPESLQEIVMTRFDRLSSRARRAIALAAVIGRQVQEDLLLALLPGASAGRWADQLQELEDVRLLARDPQHPGTYVFAHVLAQETLYQSMLQSDREAIHDRIAEALVQRGDADEQIEQIAYHLRHGAERIAAVPYLARSGERAASQYANDAALLHYRRALELIETLRPEHELKPQILSALGDVLSFTGGYDEARGYYQRALELVPPDSPEQAALLRRVGTAYLRQGNTEQALPAFRDALQVLAQAEGPEITVERARIADELGWTFFRTGDRAQAGFWLKHALGLIEEDERYLAERASIYNRLGGVSWMEGDLEGAARYTELALQIREQTASLEGIARCSNNLGVLALTRGDWDQAISYYSRVAEIHRRTGDQDGLGIALDNLLEMHVYRVELEEAHTLLVELNAIAERLGSRSIQVLIDRSRAKLAIAGEAWAEARRLALRKLHESGSNTAESIYYLLILAKASLETAHLTQALHASRLALKLASKTKDQLPQALRLRAEILMTGGALKRAGRLLAESIEQAQYGTSIPLEQAKARELLAHLAELRADQALAETERAEARTLFARLGIPVRETIRPTATPTLKQRLRQIFRAHRTR